MYVCLGMQSYVHTYFLRDVYGRGVEKQIYLVKRSLIHNTKLTR